MVVVTVVRGRVVAIHRQAASVSCVILAGFDCPIGALGTKRLVLSFNWLPPLLTEEAFNECKQCLPFNFGYLA